MGRSRLALRSTLASTIATLGVLMCPAAVNAGQAATGEEGVAPVVAEQSPGGSVQATSSKDLKAPSTGSESPAAMQTVRLRGRVGWLAEILRRRYDIALVPEANQRVLALETDEGEIVPLIEDNRGRAFRRDPELRKLDVELVVRRPPGCPLVQVVKVYAIKDDGRYEVDYWCDVCAIVMYELGPCDCCQLPNHIRFRPVDQ